MEACGSAHFWARKLIELGHTVKLMAPQFVKPYVKTNKNDARDAEAICEAVARPNMRFVPIKNVEQQLLLGLHRARQGFVKARTAQANQIRGLLAEFGIVMPKGIALDRATDARHSGGCRERSASTSRDLFAQLFTHFRDLDRQMDELGRQIKVWHRQSDAESPVGEDSRPGSAIRKRCGGERRRCKDLPQWPSVCSLVGSRSAAEVERRQRSIIRHQ